MATFWDNLFAGNEDMARSFDPAQRIDNTGINGGAVNTTTADVGSTLGGLVNQTAQTAQATMSGSDPQQFFNQLFPGDTLTPEMLTQNEAALNAHGISLVKNAAGVPGKIKINATGQVIDVIQGAGSGLNKKQWLTGDGGGGGSTLGSLGYSFGSSMAPWNDQFSAPTAEQALNSPGFKFAMEQGLKGIQNSAAAKGTLLSGGTLKALDQYGQGLALQNYGDLYNRNLGEYMLRRDNFFQNQDRPFDKNVTLAKLGQPQ